MTTVAETSRETPGIFAQRHRALTVGMVALIMLVAFEALAVATAMPVVGRELDGLGLYALAFSGALAAGMIATVLGGRWGDLYGPVVPLWAGVAVFAAGLVVSGTAPTMDVFVAGRFVQGFGGGVFQVALYVLVSRVYPAGLHPKVFSVFAAAWVVPSMIGPVITGVVVEGPGWRWVFLGVPLLVVPAALLLWRGLAAASAAGRTAAAGTSSGDRTPPGEHTASGGAASGRTPIGRRLGWAVLTAGGAALMQYGGAARDGGGPVLLLAGLAVLAAALPRLLPPGTVRVRRGLPSVIVLRGIVAGAFFGGELFLPLMLSAERGLSPAQAGLVLTGGALAWSLASWIAGRRPYDRVAILRTGPLLMAGGLLLVALAVLPGVPVAAAFLGEMLMGFGIGLVYPLLSVLVLELSSPGEEGENSASLGVGESVFTVTTVVAVGAVVAAFGATGPVYLACFALTALVAAAGAPVAGRVRV
ncbi:MFS transporter [Planomonospora venezuelensis]|uniref:MFS family permease n=1 Tax=Planomonospora venezuelensis TaxID=1999 RepID=A0A841D2Q9_PLAVE|nr:MFS transporter [Planomonospora venezuelensis]MBB5964952.1 MFS family permease [Planomonospora venezuelensis]